MTGQDLYSRALAGLNEAAFGDARWPEASKRMDEACGAKGNIVVVGDDGASGEIEISLARIYFRGQRSGYWERRYFDRLYALDERIPRLRRLPPGALVSVRSLYTPRERKRSEVYNDMARAEVQNGLNMRLFRTRKSPGDSRSIGGADSRHSDGGGLKPPLLQFVRVAGRSAGDALAIHGRYPKTPIGVVHSRRGRIVAANDVALAHLRDGGPLRDEGGGLHAARRTDDRELQGLLAGALGASADSLAGGSMGLRRPDGAAPLMIHVTPVDARGTDCRPGPVAALALTVDAARQARIDPGLLTGALGLTPAEAEVAALVAGGLTPRQVGAASERSEGTVRWHLHRVFDKLGIDRQAQLVALVRALAWFPGGNRKG